MERQHSHRHSHRCTQQYRRRGSIFHLFTSRDGNKHGSSRRSSIHFHQRFNTTRYIRHREPVFFTNHRGRRLNLAINLANDDPRPVVVQRSTRPTSTRRAMGNRLCPADRSIPRPRPDADQRHQREEIGRACRRSTGEERTSPRRGEWTGARCRSPTRAAKK